MIIKNKITGVTIEISLTQNFNQNIWQFVSYVI